ncbi:MAG: HlyD family secretion protein [Isosphaeraceae bacterium]
MTTHRPHSRPIVLWITTSFPAAVIPRASRSQDSPLAPAEMPSARTGTASEDPASRVSTLRNAEAQLEIAREWLNGRKANLSEARTILKAARARREYREVVRTNLARKFARGTAKRQEMDREAKRLRDSRAEERAAGTHIVVAEGDRDHAATKVREAEALLDIARIESRRTPEAGDAQAIKKARTRAAEARLDCARARLKSARAGVEEAQERPDSDEAGVEDARASLNKAAAQLRVAEADADLPAAKLPVPPRGNRSGAALRARIGTLCANVTPILRIS